MTAERWLPVVGAEGRYEVSDAGRVRSVSGQYAGRVLMPQTTNSGYRIVHLYRHGERSIALVHRLVAAAFVPGHFSGAVVNHRDSNKLANSAANLEWTTYAGNVAHTKASGRMRHACHAVVGTPIAGGGEVCFPSQIAAERALAGRGSSAVHHCLVGKKRSAYGYTWRRA